MKVKIGDKIYDSNNEPIMLILDVNDKKNIHKLGESETKYVVYPDDEEYTTSKIKKFMKTD